MRKWAAVEPVRRTHAAAKHPHRLNGDRGQVVLPSRHRHPEIKTSVIAPPSSGIDSPIHYSTPAALSALVQQVNRPAACNLLGERPAGVSKLASDPAG
jgi:hypothetical protein